MNETVVERHPLWLRVSHWLNVPLLFAMCWSGFNMYLALAETEGFFYEPIYMATVKHLDHLYMFKNGMTQHFFTRRCFF